VQPPDRRVDGDAARSRTAGAEVELRTDDHWHGFNAVISGEELL
jgi:hypothetical protein